MITPTRNAGNASAATLMLARHIRPLSPALARRLRWLASRIYQPQLKLFLPMDVLARLVASPPVPPSAYVIRSPRPDEDLQAWADLLNEDQGFPRWTAQRVHDEIVSQLVATDAASLIFHQGQLVGCASTCDVSTPRQKCGMGMFFYLKPAHRGRRSLTDAIVVQTMNFFLREGYERAIVTTDPYRLSALTLYLSLGYRPIRDSLWSHVQWWKIRRRLHRVLERKARDRRP